MVDPRKSDGADVTAPDVMVEESAVTKNPYKIASIATIQNGQLEEKPIAIAKTKATDMITKIAGRRPILSDISLPKTLAGNPIKITIEAIKLMLIHAGAALWLAANVKYATTKERIAINSHEWQK